MSKKRHIKNTKHSIRKLRNIIRRRGDDWAIFDKKAKVASRKYGRAEIKELI